VERFSKKSGEGRAKVLRDSIELISKKWHPQILYKLDEDFVRFSELESDLDGISSKVLSSSLSDLSQKDLVIRSDRGYKLTSKGLEMKSALDSMADWGQKFSELSEVEVLVVEDENLQREMYERWLEHYQVKAASNLEKAYNLVTSDTDIVILDRVVDGSKSDEVAEDLKEEYEGIEIVMITGVDPSLDILGLDVDYYLIKPVKEEQLLETVDEALEKADKSEDKKELLSLASKKAVLDRKLAIGGNERYSELEQKIDSLSSQLEDSEDILSRFGV